MKTILDVSSIIYAGHNGLDRRIRGFPVGGLRKLFGLINAGLSSSDFILCFDGGNIVKKELLPTYKAGRVPDYSVYAQIDLAKELLLNCNIPFYWDERYEADDYIFSVCNMFLKLGDAENVVIYSDDRDLSCCVTDNISVHNVSSNGMCIDINNYEDRVVKGVKIPYNTILLWKVFAGDSSDNYKPLHISGLDFATFASRYVEELNPLIGPQGFNQLAFAYYSVFELFVDDYKELLSPEHFKLLKEQGRIAFPYEIEVTPDPMSAFAEEYQQGVPLYKVEQNHMKIFGNGTFDQKKFNFYCSMLGLNRSTYRSFVDRDSKEAQEFYGMMELKAQELSSGVMAVERYRNKKTVKGANVTLQNMELPI